MKTISHQYLKLYQKKHLAYSLWTQFSSTTATAANFPQINPG